MLGAQESIGKRSTQRAIVSVACMRGTISRGTILRGARLAVINDRRRQRIERDDR
jgi:transposase InsO family protein